MLRITFSVLPNCGLLQFVILHDLYLAFRALLSMASQVAIHKIIFTISVDLEVSLFATSV